MTDVDPTAPFTGPHGSFVYVPMPPADTPGWAPAALAARPGIVACWLLTAPHWHPAWDQYVVSVITLADLPGVPEATLKFVGATHELLVIVLDPNEPQTVETVAAHCLTGTLPHLLPVNIAEQFQATDEEMAQVAWLACRGVCVGILNPETGDGPERVREEWLSACTRTLAHLRGETHAP